MSVSELKEALDSMHISYAGLAEKNDLREKLKAGQAMQSGR